MLKPIPNNVLRYNLSVYKKHSNERTGRSYNPSVIHSNLYYEVSKGERQTTSGNLVQSNGIVIYNGVKDINDSDIIEINDTLFNISSIQKYYDPTVVDRVHHTEILLGNVVTEITVI